MHVKHFYLEICAVFYCWTLSCLLLSVKPFNFISILALAKQECHCKNSKSTSLYVCSYSCMCRGGMGGICEPLFFRDTGSHGISPSLAWKWGRGRRPWWDTRWSHYGRKLPHWSGTGQTGTERWREGWVQFSGGVTLIRVALWVQVRHKNPLSYFEC